MDQYMGRRFNSYGLTQRLGEGSFGVVYLGEHVYTKSQVAIKLLRIPVTSAEDMKEFFTQFINEASNTIRLKHPHIVPLLDFGIQEKTPLELEGL